MQFMIWSYFYHDVIPEISVPRKRGNRRGYVSYANCGKFFALKAKRPKAERSADDVKRLDELKEMLFKCFEEQSFFNACKQFQMAKVRHEPCPFPQTTLDNMFAMEV